MSAFKKTNFSCLEKNLNSFSVNKALLSNFLCRICFAFSELNVFKENKNVHIFKIILTYKIFQASSSTKMTLLCPFSKGRISSQNFNSNNYSELPTMHLFAFLYA